MNEFVAGDKGERIFYHWKKFFSQWEKTCRAVGNEFICSGEKIGGLLSRQKYGII